MSSIRPALRLAAVCLVLLLPPRSAGSFPVSGDQAVLPPGTELNEEALDQPREIFKSEAAGGRKSYLTNLGDLAFNSPAILGGVARRAGVSCGSCHVNGANNSKLYIPGMSSRPGNFDTSGPLFNPKADNGVRDPVRIPSLRGALGRTAACLRCATSSTMSLSTNSHDLSRQRRFLMRSSPQTS